MEEFSIEKYNTGKYDVFTREGNRVRIFCTNYKDSTMSAASIIGAVTYRDNTEECYEVVNKYFRNGFCVGVWKGINESLVLQKKQWEPQNGDTYYYINGMNFNVEHAEWFTKDTCMNLLELGSCFQTKEEAEVKAKEIREILKR